MTCRRPGNLTVITGPMFAGKTSALIALARRGGAAMLALKPAFDTRAGEALIRSRDGSAIPALPIASWPAQAAGQATLLLDEAQFMAAPHYAGDVVADVLDAVRSGASVTVSGLDTDYLRQPFDVIARLRAVADEQVVLRARCHVCGEAAAWTAKRAETGQLLEVGDSDLYDARCDAHWSRPGQTEANPHAATPDITGSGPTDFTGQRQCRRPAEIEVKLPPTEAATCLKACRMLAPKSFRRPRGDRLRQC